ncbi:hypothetical protein EG19_04200 [Thermoanaerobaculum aquaticum]|uniref:Glutamate synthase domain-containing protein n=1 Tax=Thermoanaerobaculum aquaticum TaxID=1312852 RepID=A0A062Y3L3_9BACT|nr:hypothetical protein EG19_04200 [Thermoanaerobaculum aquaticum]
MVFHRFHIDTQEAPERYPHPSRFRVRVKKLRLLFMVAEELLHLRGPGRVQVALSRPCVYGVFGRPVGGLAPIHEKCVGCLRCTTQYPHVVQIVPNPQRQNLGDAYLNPDWVDTIMLEARTGRVPVRGAGYRGPFGGQGWDGMWTDMSEIVRPTRDGIHGREYISTLVDIGEKPAFLNLDAGGQITGPKPKTFSMEVPFFYDLPPANAPRRVLQTLVEAAARVDSLAFVPLSQVLRYGLAGPQVVPVVSPGQETSLQRLTFTPRLVELSSWDAGLFAHVQKLFPQAVVPVRLPAAQDLWPLFTQGVRVFHLEANYHGQAGESFLGERLRAVHDALVRKGVREEVTLLGSGGIVQAEHVPKAIICGLDAVGLDTALWVALQARFYGQCRERSQAQVRFPRFPVPWGVQRLTNLAAAWRDQLLEVLGAMGLREVRRLRGEVGRCMFQAEAEREAFAGIPVVEPPAPARDGEARKQLPQPVQWAPVVWVRRAGHPSLTGGTLEERIVAKHRHALHRGFALWPQLPFRPPALGDARWTADLILSGWYQAQHGCPPEEHLEYRVGRSGGGFDLLDFAFLPPDQWLPEDVPIDTSIPLNRRPYDPQIVIPIPWYGAGMSFGSVSEQVMLARAMVAKAWNTFTSTGEGGYPDALIPYARHVNTQVATGMFGVREETIARAPIVEFKYAQGAKPGLGGHLLGDKATVAVAKMRESVPWVSLFSPFPFHSVYSVEDHKKHVDWIKAINPEALISVKVSTPTDVDMVAVGSYYAGAHIVHLDGSYGGTGAAPEIAKKNIALPIELAIPKVHRFLLAEGIRDQLVIMASGGIRTAYDIAKAIALGADGCILGTAELIALGCTRCSNCERGRGCPFGLTTTDPELSLLVDPEWGAQRLSNLYESYRKQLVQILRRLGLKSVRELRGRTDLLVYKGGHRREA